MKKLLTFTNIIFVLAIIVYILNLCVISPDTGSTAIAVKEALQSQGMEYENFMKIIYIIMGTWGGHVNDLLGFQMAKVMSGEVWRIYTVVLTHVHLPHIVMNLAALLIAGNHIEKKYGWKKTILLFLILMIVNNFVTDLILTKILNYEVALSCGASGWITTLMGMILARCILDKKYWKEEFKTGARVYLIIYFVSTTFVLSPNIFTITAHMSGLIAGFLVEFCIQKLTKKKKEA